MTANKPSKTRPFQALCLPEIRRRRDLRVHEVMPEGPGWLFGAALTGGSIATDLGLVPIQGFGHLFELIGETPSPAGFDRVRRELLLIEGAHALPPALAKTLSEISGSFGTVFARHASREGPVLRERARDYLESSDIFSPFEDPFSEYEVVDGDCRWYMRFAYDEVFAFFAVNQPDPGLERTLLKSDSILSLEGAEQYRRSCRPRGRF